ncbi:hypothetical protein KIPB_002725 [Kipferlia bialata]|uniref:Zona occludens toxin N-terminal domain-containing protein n=1 Tax=Kipferlia bialata TaxID=797122 RepID=A0A9K3CRB0_9EUKA|nr:hypothetical protein KIPB_002725 [Kipferlia bialata]|eukprot:g2725.t1
MYQALIEEGGHDPSALKEAHSLCLEGCARAFAADGNDTFLSKAYLCPGVSSDTVQHAAELGRAEHAARVEAETVIAGDRTFFHPSPVGQVPRAAWDTLLTHAEERANGRPDLVPLVICTYGRALIVLAKDLPLWTRCVAFITSHPVDTWVLEWARLQIQSHFSADVASQLLQGLGTDASLSAPPPIPTAPSVQVSKPVALPPPLSLPLPSACLPVTPNPAPTSTSGATVPVSKAEQTRIRFRNTVQTHGEAIVTHIRSQPGHSISQRDLMLWLPEALGIEEGPIPPAKRAAKIMSECGVPISAGKDPVTGVDTLSIVAPTPNTVDNQKVQLFRDLLVTHGSMFYAYLCDRTARGELTTKGQMTSWFPQVRSMSELPSLKVVCTLMGEAGFPVGSEKGPVDRCLVALTPPKSVNESLPPTLSVPTTNASTGRQYVSLHPSGTSKDAKVKWFRRVVQEYGSELHAALRKESPSAVKGKVWVAKWINEHVVPVRGQAVMPNIQTISKVLQESGHTCQVVKIGKKKSLSVPRGMSGKVVTQGLPSGTGSGGVLGALGSLSTTQTQPVSATDSTVESAPAAVGAAPPPPSIDDRLSMTHAYQTPVPQQEALSGVVDGSEGERPAPPFLASVDAFMASAVPPSLLSRPVSAVLGPDSKHIPGRGLLGVSVPEATEEGMEGGRYAYARPSARPSTSGHLWLNTRDPFACVVCGVQNSGKSHTLNSIVESCMLKCPPITDGSDMVSLVCSYDRTQHNYCESIGLALAGPAGVTASPAVVLVSPSNYRQRQAFFRSLPHVQVVPLLFPFQQLDAAYLRMLMGLDGAKQPLYAGVLMSLLRKVQRSGASPTWDQFLSLIEGARFSRDQMNPLNQRLEMLAGLVLESRVNADVAGSASCMSVLASLQPGSLVICDLTDPMVAPEDANAIFSVVSQLFVGCHASFDKMLVLDEAHKYLKVAGPLVDTMLTTVRQMRHYGCRVVLSTQSPADIPQEFLELCSLTVIHRFFSPTWANHLCKCLHLGMDSHELLEAVSQCGVGECLLFDPHASNILGQELGASEGTCVKARIRPRLTLDAGSSMRARGVERGNEESSHTDAADVVDEGSETEGGEVVVPTNGDSGLEESSQDDTDADDVSEVETSVCDDTESAMGTDPEESDSVPGIEGGSETLSDRLEDVNE